MDIDDLNEEQDARELKCIHRKSGLLSLRFLLCSAFPHLLKEASGEEGERKNVYKVKKEGGQKL